MINNDINIENLISIMDTVPRRTPWFYVLYAYIVSHLRTNNGLRVVTARDVRMCERSFRNKFPFMEVLGFVVPPSSRQNRRKKK